MNILLCGLHQSGKTTIGKSLALELGYSYLDTDALIEDHYAQKTQNHYSSRMISIKEGEEFFRVIESERLASLQRSESTVISLGGGSLLSSSNRDIIAALGTLIYIKTPSDVVWKRILDNGLPSFLDPSNPKKSFLAMVEKRIPIYEDASDFTVDTQNLSVSDAVSEIKRILHYG